MNVENDTFEKWNNWVSFVGGLAARFCSDSRSLYAAPAIPLILSTKAHLLTYDKRPSFMESIGAIAKAAIPALNTAAGILAGSFIRYAYDRFAFDGELETPLKCVAGAIAVTVISSHFNLFPYDDNSIVNLKDNPTLSSAIPITHPWGKEIESLQKKLESIWTKTEEVEETMSKALATRFNQLEKAMRDRIDQMRSQKLPYR